VGRVKTGKSEMHKTLMEVEGNIAELGLEEAMDFIDKKNTKLVWLGYEPEDVISRALEVPKDKIVKISPEEIVYFDRKQMERLNNHVFAGYNDSTSKFVIRFMKNKCSINATSLKGGVNSILGDIL